MDCEGHQTPGLIKLESNQSTNQLSHDDIVQNRRERRKAKQLERRINREKIQLQRKLNQQSDQVKVISAEELAINKYESTIIKNAPKTKKFKKSYNLLEFIVERKTQELPAAEIKTVNTLKLNKGKIRENRKKRLTVLKKEMLHIRENRQSKQTTDISANLETSIENLERLNIADDSNKKVSRIHSRHFRLYCDNIISNTISQCAEKLLKELFRFQKRAYEKNETKARAHRRFVVGFKEVQRQIEIRKVKLVIIAPDCEPCDYQGGVDEIIEVIKNKCKERITPYLFALRRRQLAYVLFKKVPVSCVGILNYDGSQDVFKQLMEYLLVERENYNKLKDVDVA